MIRKIWSKFKHQWDLSQKLSELFNDIENEITRAYASREDKTKSFVLIPQNKLDQICIIFRTQYNIPNLKDYNHVFNNVLNKLRTLNFTGKYDFLGVKEGLIISRNV